MSWYNTTQPGSDHAVPRIGCVKAPFLFSCFFKARLEREVQRELYFNYSVQKKDNEARGDREGMGTRIKTKTAQRAGENGNVAIPRRSPAVKIPSFGRQLILMYSAYSLS